MSELSISRPVNFSFVLLGLPLLSILGNWVVCAVYIFIVFILLFFDYLHSRSFDINLPFFPLWVLVFIWNIYIALKSANLRLGFDYYVGTILVPFFIYFIILNVKLDKTTLTKLFDLFILSGVVLSLFSIYIFADSGFDLKLRIPSLWENFNIFAGYLMILFLFNLSFLLNKNLPWKKFAYSVTLVIILFGIFLTQTRGVWMATVLAIVFFFFKKPKVILPASIVMGVLVLLFFNVINDRFLSVKNFGNDVSSLGRLQAWLSSIILIKENFFAGYGFDSYELLRDTVFSFYFVEVHHSHNTYLRMLLESGFIGFFFYFIFIFGAFFLTFSLSKNNELIEYKGYIDGFQLSLFALFVAFNFEPYLSLYGLSTITIWIVVSFVFKFKFAQKSLT